MIQLPQFTDDGLLPPGDYTLTVDELADSMLVHGPNDLTRYPNWDAAWRRQLVDNFGVSTFPIRRQATRHYSHRRSVMIRNEPEYQQAVKQLEAESQRLSQQQAKLEEMGLKAKEIKRAMDPMRSFHEQLAEEVASYERLKRSEFGEIRNLRGIGQLLIGLRIALNISQRDLAERLGVHESQVSRDERNEYHGITVERANRILEVLGVETHTTVELPEPAAAPGA